MIISEIILLLVADTMYYAAPSNFPHCSHPNSQPLAVSSHKWWPLTSYNRLKFLTYHNLMCASTDSAFFFTILTRGSLQSWETLFPMTAASDDSWARWHPRERSWNMLSQNSTMLLTHMYLTCLRAAHRQCYRVLPYKPRHHWASSKSPQKQLSPTAVSLATSDFGCV